VLIKVLFPFLCSKRGCVDVILLLLKYLEFSNEVICLELFCCFGCCFKVLNEKSNVLDSYLGYLFFLKRAILCCVLQ